MSQSQFDNRGVVLIGPRVRRLAEPLVIPLDQQDTKFAINALWYRFWYGLAGLVVQALCMTVGVVLVFNQVVGNGHWTADFWGISINDATPGVALFFVGIGALLITRFNVEIGEPLTIEPHAKKGNVSIGDRWFGLGSQVTFPLAHQEKPFAQLAQDLRFWYAMAGLAIGVLYIGAGVLLLVNGIGNDVDHQWSANFFGIRLTDTTPGITLFFIGLATMLVTRFDLKIDGPPSPPNPGNK